MNLLSLGFLCEGIRLHCGCMLSGYISCELMPSVTLGSTSGLAHGANSSGFGAVKLESWGLTASEVELLVGLVGASLSLSVLPHSEHLPAVLLFCFSGATVSPIFSLQSLLTPQRAFRPGDFWHPLTLKECLAFRHLQVLITGGRSAGYQYSGRKGMFPVSQPCSLGDLQIWF